MERIKPVKFFAAGLNERYMLAGGNLLFEVHATFEIEVARRYHLKTEPFLEWCREHGLTVTMKHDAITDLYTGEVRFYSAEQRFEFKMRWNV